MQHRGTDSPPHAWAGSPSLLSVFCQGPAFLRKQSLTSPPPIHVQASPRDTLAWDKARGRNNSLSFLNCVPAQQRVQHRVHSFANVLDEQGVPFRDGLLDDVQVAMGTAQKPVHNSGPREGALPAPEVDGERSPRSQQLILSCKGSEAFCLCDPVGLREVERGAPRRLQSCTHSCPNLVCDPTAWKARQGYSPASQLRGEHTPHEGPENRTSLKPPATWPVVEQIVQPGREPIQLSASTGAVVTRKKALA